jgi:hypothetical protein
MIGSPPLFILDTVTPPAVAITALLVLVVTKIPTAYLVPAVKVTDDIDELPGPVVIDCSTKLSAVIPTDVAVVLPTSV